MVSKRRRPQLEVLEAKDLPSTALVVPGGIPAIIVKAAHHHRVILSGQIQGAYTTAMGIPDAGQRQDLNGTGVVRPLGAVQVTGSLHLTGFIARGEASGTLTLSNSKGTLTLNLVGPVQTGFSGPPTTLTYTVSAGTGSFAGTSGHGSVALHETTAPLVPGSGLLDAGAFTMTFRPGA